MAARAMVALLSAADLRDVQELFSPERRKEHSFGLDFWQGEKTQDAHEGSSSSDDDGDSLPQEEAWSSAPPLPGLRQTAPSSTAGLGGSARGGSSALDSTISADEVCEDLRDLQRLVTRLVAGADGCSRSGGLEGSLEVSSYDVSEVRRCITELRRQLQCLELHPNSSLQVMRSAAQYQSELETARAEADTNSAVLRAESREARGAARQLLELLEASERRNAKLEAEAQPHGVKDRENAWLHAEFEQQCCRADQLRVEVESLACELNTAQRRRQAQPVPNHSDRQRSEVLKEPVELTALAAELRTLQDGHHSELMVLAAVMEGLTEGEAYAQLHEQMQRQRELTTHLHESLESSSHGAALQLGQPAMLRELEEHQALATELEQHAIQISSGLTGRLEEQQGRAEALEICAEKLACDLAMECESSGKALDEEEAEVERLGAEVQDAYEQLDVNSEQLIQMQSQVTSTQAELREREQMVANLQLVYTEEQETADNLARESKVFSQQLQEREAELAQMHAEVEEMRSLDVPGLHVHPLPSSSTSDPSGGDSDEPLNPAGESQQELERREIAAAEAEDRIASLAAQLRHLQSESAQERHQLESSASDAANKVSELEEELRQPQMAGAEDLAEALHAKIDASTEELAELREFYKSEKTELAMFKEHVEVVLAHGVELQQEMTEQKQRSCAVEEQLEAQEQQSEWLKAKCSALEKDLATECQSSEGVAERMSHELALERRCEQALALDVETTAHEFMQLRSLQRAQVEECEHLAANAQAKWEGQESELQEQACALRSELQEKSRLTSATPAEEAQLLSDELSEQRHQSQQLEVWLENLARELTAERQRSAARGPSHTDAQQVVQLEAEVASLTSELGAARQHSTFLPLKSRKMPLPPLREEAEDPLGESGTSAPPEEVDTERPSLERELQLTHELEESKSASERLEVCLETLARELASERLRAGEVREEAVAREQQALTAYKQQEEHQVQHLMLEAKSESQSAQSETLHHLLEEHHRSALQMQAEAEVQASQLTSELEGRMALQEKRAERLEMEYVTLAEELVAVQQQTEEAAQSSEVQQIEEELEKFCDYESSMGAELQLLRASEATLQADAEAQLERFSAYEGSVSAELQQLRASESSLEADVQAQQHKERAMQREAAGALEEAVESSRKLSDRNTQLEGRHRYDVQVVDELRKQLEQQWAQTAELEASQAALECQLTAKFQQSGDQELLEARQEAEEQRQVVAELERKLEFERQRAAQQEAALRAEAEEAEAVAEDLREQLGEQSKRFAEAGLSAQLASELQAKGLPLTYESKLRSAPAQSGMQCLQHVTLLTGNARRRLELSTAASMTRAFQKFYLWTWWSICCTVLCKKRIRQPGSADVTNCVEHQNGAFPSTQASRAERLHVAQSLQQLGRAAGSNVCISRFLFLQIGFMAFRMQAHGADAHGAEHTRTRTGHARRVSAALETQGKQTLLLQALVVLQRWRACTVEVRIGATCHGLDRRVRQVAANHSTLIRFWDVISRDIAVAALAGLFSAWAVAAGVRSASGIESRTPVADPSESASLQSLRPLLVEAAHKRCNRRLVWQCFESWRHSSQELCEWHAIGTQPCWEAKHVFRELSALGARIGASDCRRLEHENGEGSASSLHQKHQGLRHQAGAAALLMEQDHLFMCSNCFSRWRFTVWAAATERAACTLARRVEDDCLAEVAAAVHSTAVTAKPLARLLVRCDRRIVCQMYLKLWSAEVSMLALHARVQTLISVRRNDGKRQFEEAQMVFKAARLGMEVTAVCEKLAAADRRVLHSSANRRCTEVSTYALSRCFFRLMWHAICKDCLLAWHLVTLSSSLRSRIASEMCSCWAEVESQSVESQRLCNTVKLIQAQVSEAICAQSRRDHSLEARALHGRDRGEDGHRESTVSLLFFPPPALELWARLCLFTWHHFMTSRTLVTNLVTSSEAVSADRCTGRMFTAWRLHTGRSQLKRHSKEARFRAISETDTLLLRTTMVAWVALSRAPLHSFTYRLLRKRPSRLALTADMHTMRYIVHEWHRAVIAERRWAHLQWVDPAAVTRQSEVDVAAPRVYQAVLLPAGISVNAGQTAARAFDLAELT